MGTRGHLGGVAEATLQAMLILDAAGKDVVFLETVGTGQSEIEVIGVADTVVLVLMPGSGDSIQALKAGIMEIPDVIAINKMDHPAAKTMLTEVRSVLSLDRDRRLEGADRADRGAPRGERARALGEGRGAPRVPRARGRARGTPPPEPGRRGLRGRVRAGTGPPRAQRSDPTPSSSGCSTTSRPAGRSALGRLRDHVQGVRGRGRCRRSADIERARERLAGVARVTPVYRSETISRLAGRDVHLKAENLQRTGSFKTRGAVNKLSTLGEAQRAAGVVAASAGNHAQAVAWAAREAGVRATIFVPQDAAMAKVEATKSYGAEVRDGGAGDRGGARRRAEA